MEALKAKLKALCAEQKAFIEKYSVEDPENPGTKGWGNGMKDDQLVEFHNREKEINEVGAKLDASKAIHDAESRMRLFSEGTDYEPAAGKDPSEMVKARLHEDPFAVAEDSLKAQIDALKKSGTPICPDRGGSVVFSLPAEVVNAMKAVMTASATSYGWPPFVPRIDRVETLPIRRVMVPDLIPNIPSEAPAFKYLEETVEENNAAPVAENAQKPYSQFRMVERTVTIEMIAHLMSMTEQQVEDVPQFTGFATSRGTTLLWLKTEDQVMTGNGSSPNLQGFLTKSGINTQARGSDNIPDALYKGAQLVRTTGFAEPSAFIIHPNDWTDVRLMKTTEGVYIWGPPSEAGPERMWGKTVVATTAITEGTGYTGDFGLYSALYGKGDVRIAITNANASDFEYNRLTMRIEHRKALAIFRPTAFTKITGL